MKKEFSFYEFVGVIVPSVILLFFLNAMISEIFGKSIVDFSKVGDTTVFLIVSYGFGHLIHALGNVFEKIIWWFAGGMQPSGSQWEVEKRGLFCTRATRRK